MKVLLTHTPQARAQYYGERSLKGLQAIAQVKLHQADEALDAVGLIEAADDVDIIVVDSSLNELTQGLVRQFPAVTYVKNQSGYGNMPYARNLGLVRSRGDIVVFLDDDAFPERSWLSVLGASPRRSFRTRSGFRSIKLSRISLAYFGSP